MATILFLHGWHSVPGGVKPTCLKDHGHTVINPALDDDDFEAAVRTAQEAFALHQSQVVVGSSRGGAVAMNINSGTARLVLLCPAWKKRGTVKTVRPSTVILHSKNDDVIPFADSEELASQSGAMLIEVGRDHRLADEESLSVMLWACNLLASGDKLPWLDDESQSPANSASKGKATHQEEASYVCDACGEDVLPKFVSNLHDRFRCCLPQRPVQSVAFHMSVVVCVTNTSDSSTPDFVTPNHARQITHTECTWLHKAQRPVVLWRLACRK